MAKIFDVQDWLKNHPNRNNFDLTHKVHGSYQMGKLYPVLCKPVVPTDSFRIDTAVSLRFTPMPFPTQSNMRVIFHYFYVRNKNIWKNWSNWLQGLEEHTPPYINRSREFFKRSSLCDYLDVPTSFVAPSSSSRQNFGPIAAHLNGGIRDVFNYDHPALNPNVVQLREGASVIMPYSSLTSNEKGYLLCYPYQSDRIYNGKISKWEILGFQTYSPLDPQGNPTLECDFSRAAIFVVDNGNIVAASIDCVSNVVSQGSYDNLYVEPGSFYEFPRLSHIFEFDSSKSYQYVLGFLVKGGVSPIGELNDSYPINFSYSDHFLYMNVEPRSIDISSEGSIPYYCSENTSENSIKVSALPFRAYESIYNAFYRNSQGVQPFQINGVTKYNQYVTNDDDGSDSTDYHLFERNWELDAYTSCLISPQQGNVPYVGITDISALGRMSVQTPDGESAEVRLNDLENGVEITNLHGTSQESRAYALRAASSGFTIPEFREANALQRFLEMNIRKGYKYIDFIEGHFGKKPTYSEMDMPEFIGGFSQRISVNEVSNTNGVDNDKLGAIAGQARAIGGSKHGITHYFDDFGFVVGIMCIVPDNAYDSILPKHFNLKEPLDCYFPEFSQLSYLPLTHEELAPIQTVNDPRGSSYRDLTKVFGYQRPNHDLVWFPDTVHGLFRDAGGIGNSVICRRFAERPELSNDFLTIKPSETDTIFNYTFGDNDVCLGEVVLKISAKRPVPRLVVPQIS